MGASTWEEKMEDAKKRHRPRLKDWGRDGFASHRAEDFEKLSRLRRSDDETIGRGEVARVSCRDLTPEEFIERYEKTNTPLIIEGVPEAEGWRAEERWEPRELLASEQLEKYTFKCGEDDDGKSVRVRLKHFFKYMKHQRDDSPLYIFDSTFDDDREAKCLLRDYKVPGYFPDDLFSLVGEKRRPPYRWFLVGPKRSGTCLHIDPLGTSAWNTVVSGRKRWVLFPPGTPKDLAKGKALYRPREDDEPVNYFVDIIPRMLTAYDRHTVIYEFIQEPGETVFVPGGWWHAVLNLEDSIAVTQNFVSRVNFPTVWRKTRTGRKKMARRWLELLKEQEPGLAAVACRLNEEDGFHMETEEERRERKERKKRERERKKRKVLKEKGRNGEDDDRRSQTSSDGGKKEHKRRRRQEGECGGGRMVGSDCESGPRGVGSKKRYD